MAANHIVLDSQQANFPASEMGNSLPYPGNPGEGEKK
jgi:hypothetical protein